MGLDMYLVAERYVSEHIGDHPKRKQLTDLANQMLPPDGSFGAITISRNVAYWRKANAIHAWFVDKVQNGTDDCGYYDVELKQLEELRDQCKRVLDDPNRGKEALPTQEGCFFGNTDYGEDYLDDLKNTIEQIDKVIAWIEAEQALTGQKYSSIDLKYHSSW